jgi:type IV pilus assembly protein PilE
MTVTNLRARGPRGFTLVELMIVVVVVAILAAVAYPSYTQYVARSHRTELTAKMAAAQQWLERVYSETYSYPSDTTFQAQGFGRSPDAGTQQYTLTLTVPAGGQSYSLKAERTAGSSMASDACGNLTVTNTGVKSVASFTTSKYPEASDALAACWR